MELAEIAVWAFCDMFSGTSQKWKLLYFWIGELFLFCGISGLNEAKQRKSFILLQSYFYAPLCLVSCNVRNTLVKIKRRALIFVFTSSGNLFK